MSESKKLKVFLNYVTPVGLPLGTVRDLEFAIGVCHCVCHWGLGGLPLALAGCQVLPTWGAGEMSEQPRHPGSGHHPRRSTAIKLAPLEVFFLNHRAGDPLRTRPGCLPSSCNPRRSGSHPRSVSHPRSGATSPEEASQLNLLRERWFFKSIRLAIH